MSPSEVQVVTTPLGSRRTVWGAGRPSSRSNFQERGTRTSAPTGTANACKRMLYKSKNHMRFISRSSPGSELLDRCLCHAHHASRVTGLVRQVEPAVVHKRPAQVFDR